MIADAFRSCPVERLQLEAFDFSALSDGSFLTAATCRGLQSLWVRGSIVPLGFVSDDLLRLCAANGVFDLKCIEDENEQPHVLSEDVILDFCFPSNALPDGQQHRLVPYDFEASDAFVASFFEVGAFTNLFVCMPTALHRVLGEHVTQKNLVF